MNVGIFNDTALKGHPGTQAVMQTLVAGLRSEGMRSTYFWPSGLDWRPHAQVLKEAKIDALIVNGEGSIHNSESRPRARFLCELATFAKEHLNIPSFLLNCTLYRLRAQELDHIRNFNGIYVRETSSEAYLGQHGIKSTFVPDLSFFEADLHRWRGKPGAGAFVTDSVFHEISTKLADYSRTVKATFLPMDPPKDTSLKARHAKLVRSYRKILAKYRSPKLPELTRQEVPKSEYFDKFLTELAGAEVVVTGRLHTVTLALALRKPFVAIESNTPKIAYVLQDALGGVDRIFGSSSEDVAEALSRMPREFDAIELNAIDSYLASGVVAKDQMFAEIRQQIAIHDPGR